MTDLKFESMMTMDSKFESIIVDGFGIRNPSMMIDSKFESIIVDGFRFSKSVMKQIQNSNLSMLAELK